MLGLISKLINGQKAVKDVLCAGCWIKIKDPRLLAAPSVGGVDFGAVYCAVASHLCLLFQRCQLKHGQYVKVVTFLYNISVK